MGWVRLLILLAGSQVCTGKGAGWVVSAVYRGVGATGWRAAGKFATVVKAVSDLSSFHPFPSVFLDPLPSPSTELGPGSTGF